MRPFLLLPLLVSMTGCLWISANDQDARIADFDADGDGVISLAKGGRDCDDTNPDIRPAAPEICNDIDDNCDDVIDTDAEDAIDWTVDSDGDGYGADSTLVRSCASPGPEYVDQGGDCDDTDVDFNPGAPERCDGIDNDCTGTADDGEGDPWYPDADKDGFGVEATPVFGCDAPGPAFAATTDDCDDNNDGVFPGAPERCNLIDDDCDGSVDNDPVDPTLWYRDTDGDTYGVDNDTTLACEAPASHTDRGGDCDDTRDDVNPSEDERCNDGRDDDCDPSTDEAIVDGQPWYLDDDGDGFGLTNDKIDACDAPSGYAANNGDCDDSDPDANPDARWFIDTDADGFGAGSAIAQCLPVADRVPVDGDCDDADMEAYPDAPLTCDERDANCDGAIDNDADEDGFSDQACGGRDCLDDDPAFTPDSGCADGTSCADILDKDPDAPTGDYMLDPDGAKNGNDPFEVPCDMDDDGGGWTLMFADDANLNGIEPGWSVTGTTECTNEGLFIGGPGKIAGTDNINRTVDLLGVAHTEVRLRASFAFFDQWSGESGWLMADDEEVWSMAYTESGSDPKQCARGSDHDGFVEAEGFGTHSADSLVFRAGTDTTVSALKNFGIDDVEVWIR